MGDVPTVFHRYTTRRAKLLGATIATSALTAGLLASAPAFANPGQQEPTGLEIAPELADNLSDQPEELDEGRYIVQLETPSVVEHENESNPNLGEEGIDFDSSEVASYKDKLDDERDDLADDHGVTQDAEYDTVLNGFAGFLDADQAAALSKDDRVKGVYKDELMEPDTDNTPEFLGLEGSEGNAWDDEFGDPESAGEGVIVGIVDTGVWPENPSLAPLPEPRPDQDVIDAKWNGECDEGDEADDAYNVECNNKLIGAQYFDTRGEADGPNGWASPREEVNHGTHVSTTAAGNYQTEVEIDGQEFTSVSGMAPAARVATYKVCWALSGSCASSNSVAAIEQAVLDGVDVINFSIGGSRSSVITPVALAYFNAAASGVFVANSAGNSGPDSTVAHNYPWTTTVAASTHDRTFSAEMNFDGNTVPAGAFTSTQEFGVVNAKDIVADGADADQARHCATGTLDADAVNGEAVLCDRGIAFAEMATEVDRIGGDAFVVLNQEDSEARLISQSYEVPMVHVLYEDGVALEEYAASAEEPTFTVEVGTSETTAPQMADFSSAGPTQVQDGNLLKPDITAPGVEILAGYPEWVNGNDYGLMQGTSMASPHIAGLGALLKGANPDWTPAQVKSAIMTTAYTTDTEGNTIQRSGEDATMFDFGAGHVDPTEMFDPGLTYNHDAPDWIKYMCSIGQGQQLPELAPLCDSDDAAWDYGDPWDLNYPSIQIDKLAGSVEVTRTVTNVDEKMGVYFPEIDAPDGITVSIDKRVLVVRPGDSVDYTLTIKSDGAVNNEFAFGDLKLRDNRGHEVRSPIAVKPIVAAVDGEFKADTASGSETFEGRSSFDGTMTANVSGLEKSEEKTATLTNPTGDSFDTSNPSESEHTKSYVVDATDSELVRFATYNDDHVEGADLDLFVYQVFEDGSAALVGNSATAASNESVTLGGGYYVVFVDLWGGPDSVDSVMHSWSVDAEATGNAQVDPESFEVTSGGDFTVDFSWEVDAGRYFGAINYADPNGDTSTTLVSVMN